MLPNLSLLGLKIDHALGWAPTTREGWEVVILCVLMTLIASLVFSRFVRLIIMLGVIAALLVISSLTGTTFS
jgi:hypothetical protein